jgi:AraC-like DNA-binding protein
MILNRQYFKIAGRCVLERLVIKTPLRYSGVFPNEACFLFIKSGNVLLAAPTENLTIAATGGILLNCGNYFADLVQQSSGEMMELIAVHFYPDMLSEMYQHAFPSTLPKTGFQTQLEPVRKSNVLTSFFDGLSVYFENPSLATPDLLILKIKELLLLLFQTSGEASLTALFGRLFTPREVSIKTVVDAHRLSNLTITELATLCGLSLSSFKRAFQKLFNETPANYMKAQKLKEAQKLLRISTHTISEICFQVGFNEVSHFTKSFKKQFGFTPFEYRRRAVLALHEQI